MKNLYITALMLLATLPSMAFTVRTKPGQLAEDLAAVDATDKTLAITGVIDVRDFETIRSLEGIDVLDLSEVFIAEYASATPVFPGRTWFAEHSLPPYSLFETTFTEIKLPNSLTDIREGALAGISVKTLTIPSKVKEMASYVLYGAKELTELNLPRSLASLGSWAFAGCSALTDVNLQQTSVTELPEHCFSGTTNLRSIDASKILAVGREAFSGSGIKKLSLPKANTFAQYALEGMSSLETVTINKDAIISGGLLMNDVSLNRIDGVPENIPDLFATNCVSYSPATALTTATQVGNFAFAGCVADKFVLGSNVANISDGAFAGCRNLVEIDARALAGFTPKVSASAFDGIDVSSVVLIVLDTCEEIWHDHPVWGGFDIIGRSITGVGEIAEDKADSINIIIQGAALHATATQPGLTLAVYDMEGRSIGLWQSESDAISVPLTDLPEGILLVNASSTSGGTKQIKVLN